MEIKELVKPHVELVERFRKSPEQAPLDILRENWRSIACMSCGACCCSSVIPILKMDFDAFYQRLGLTRQRDEFAKIFLQDRNPEGFSCYIETEKYGGKCIFLEKKEFFRCVAWDERPEVCSEYFCLDIVNFEKYLAGEEQDRFSGEKSWEENFDDLLLKTKTESPLAFFVKEMSMYVGMLKSKDTPAWFDSWVGETKE